MGMFVESGIKQGAVLHIQVSQTTRYFCTSVSNSDLWKENPETKPPGIRRALHFRRLVTGNVKRLYLKSRLFPGFSLFFGFGRFISLMWLISFRRTLSRCPLAVQCPGVPGSSA